MNKRISCALAINPWCCLTKCFVLVLKGSLCHTRADFPLSSEHAFMMIYMSMTGSNLKWDIGLHVVLTLISEVAPGAITIRTNHKPSNHHEDDAAKLAVPPPRIAEDKFHARLLPANCVPLSIKFIFFSPHKTLNWDISTGFFFLNANHAATRDILIHSGLWQQRLARRCDDWNQISYLLTCLRGQIACLASNQYLALWHNNSLECN